MPKSTTKSKRRKRTVMQHDAKALAEYWTQRQFRWEQEMAEITRPMLPNFTGVVLSGAD